MLLWLWHSKPGALDLGWPSQKPFGVFIQVSISRALWAHWRWGGEQNMAPVFKGKQPPPHSALHPKTPDRHTLALLSLMSSGPRFPAPWGAGSPTSICHWPKAPRALFTRHFLTGKKRSNGIMGMKGALLFSAESWTSHEVSEQDKSGSYSLYNGFVHQAGTWHSLKSQ